MYNDLSKLKLNLMLIRKASIRVALVLLLVYLVLHFSSLQGWMFEELTSFSQISSITFFVLSTTMFVLEDEIQKNHEQVTFWWWFPCYDATHGWF